MDTLLWVIIIAAVAVAAIALTAAFLSMQQRKRTGRLQNQFGPEYDRTLSESGSRRDAESDLLERQKRVAKLKLRDLTPQQRKHFTESWTSVQTQFVDDPAAAVGDAQDLVDEAMQARGFPMGEFDQKAADISVEHPYVVENYRSARDIADASERGDADTEQLRQAMVHYRSLFTELTNTGERPRIERTEDADVAGMDGDARAELDGAAERRRGDPRAAMQRRAPRAR